MGVGRGNRTMARVTLLLLGRLQTLSVRTGSKIPPGINPEQPGFDLGKSRGWPERAPSRQSGSEG